MAEKTILILADGMRPDGLLNCGNDFVKTLLKKSKYSLTAQTVMPSVTLPCHMSLFHSVDPERHGITTNTYVPQVRPIEGLFDALARNGKTNGNFFNWEQLRDLSRPGHVDKSVFANLHSTEKTDGIVTDEAIKYISEKKPDFVFLYLGMTDEAGHDYGWMSKEYLAQISVAVGCVEKVYNSCGEEYNIIFTADHGGHARSHGTDCAEDMTIPIFCTGKSFPQGQEFKGGSIKDIAVTVAKLAEIEKVKEWEGEPLI
ncbi:MAG: alkaline phosphatase family protein [Clostridia bacterium]|nr:alkaline phosphatase family protein [Clostridia bacterium]